jgi:hypothetical protein
MLKLTDANDGSAVYVSPLHLSIMETLEKGTKLWMAAGVEQRVTETPDEIMAMEQMVYFMNPMMVLKP